MVDFIRALRLGRAAAVGSGLLLGGLLFGATPAAAQDGFLFKRPVLTVGVHAGFAAPRTESQIWDFTSDQLTVDGSDFRSVPVRFELDGRLSERLDLGIDLGFNHAETRSEFREWVDQDDLPIEQTTTLERSSLSATAKFYLLPRGRQVSRFAWIPNDWAPYLGGGAGVMWYSFEQEGDFVDFQTLDIFFDHFESDGTTPVFHVRGGIDVSLGPRWLLTGDARYEWASAEMSRDFVDFDEIDLAGFQATLGIAVRL